MDLNCIVTETITDRLPSFTFSSNNFRIPSNIKLADPEFFASSEIDVLIGVDVFWDLMCLGRINATSQHPTLLKTQLGWILAGKTALSGTYPTKINSFCVAIRNRQVIEDISRFWEMEEVDSNANSSSSQSEICETHFLNTIQQNSEGRFIVSLPIKEGMSNKLGDSKAMALRRFYSLERRLNRDSDLKLQYTQFLKEYLSLNHMKLVHSDADQGSCYLPHHCVFKPSSETTKLRVVFDASAKTDSGYSLNDILRVGPVIQDDLFAILIHFRLHKYVFTTDVKKMYRQILVDPSQTRYQRILWRHQDN